MHRVLLERFLACPLDREPALEVAEGQFEGDSLVHGALRCRKCGTRFPVEDGIPNFFIARPEVDAAFEAKRKEAQARDADSTGYDRTVSTYHTGLEMDALLDGLTVRSGEVVVDLGAGTGRLTQELVRRGATVLALDLSARSLALNREKCRSLGPGAVHYVAADACALPLRSELADAVGSGMMLEHLPTAQDRARCLEGILRVLRPGGRLSMTVYNYSLRKRRKQPREGFHGTSLYFYNLDSREMRGLLSGFEVRTLTALLNLPRNLQLRPLDRLLTRVPPLARLTGQLLWAVASRPEARA